MVAGLRPPADRMARVLRWFAAQGFEAHDAGFSISLTGEAAAFERLFDAALVEAKGPGPALAFEPEPTIPEDVAADIQAVTVSARPDFFA